MGFQFRRRTKGKNNWFNVSSSKKRGFGVSTSVKVDKNLTLNFGGKGNRRATINFGNGLKYVAYRPRKSKPKKKSTSAYSSDYQFELPAFLKPKPSMSRDEVFAGCQDVIIDTASLIPNLSDLDVEIVVDLYNAIVNVRQQPDYLEERDIKDILIISCTRFTELCERLEDQKVKQNINEICNNLIVMVKQPLETEKDSYGALGAWMLLGLFCLLAIIINRIITTL